MKFTPTHIADSFVVTLDKHEDHRGFLARTWDKKEFADHGVELDPLQGYVCYTNKKGTIRGLHFLIPPEREVKLTRVTRGKLYEVVVDLRPDSSTYKQWFGKTFKAEDYVMLVVPVGCAHAVLTLEDNTEYISYYSAFYDPRNERGIRYDDPALAISWPIPVTKISDKDKSWPNFAGGK